MHTRHINRNPRGGLYPGRREVDTRPDIESVKVPSVKIGRYVDFSGDGVLFANYLRRLELDEGNARGLSKGWFSIAMSPIFVEYADITTGLGEMLVDRARPRTYAGEVRRTVESLRTNIRGITASDSERVDKLNASRKEAVATAIANGDHVDEIQEFSWLHEPESSRWGTSLFSLLKQPKVMATSGSTTAHEYGFPIAQGLQDQILRDDLAELIKSEGLPLPEQMQKGKRPVVPALSLHRELSGMVGGEPVLPVPPQVQLGPLEIHRF